jgi:hypothetical protein
MALPKQLGDREYQKFIETADGDVAVRQGPGGISDSDGNELGLNKFGQAKVLDERVLAATLCNTDLLRKILFQLEILTEVEI